MKFRIWCIRIAFFGALQFLLLSTLAMAFYPGGTIKDRSSEGYSFFYNYFSDLGREGSWNGMSNDQSQSIYMPSLIAAGASLLLFFGVLPGQFRELDAQPWAWATAIAGVLAALGYIGIALTPTDQAYVLHTFLVRGGFIAFLIMCFFYATAIRKEPGYPDRYATAIGIFSAVLLVQILIMLFGPRSWTSPFALMLQASAQKVVVYAEMACMIYLAWGAVGYARRAGREEELLL